MEAHRGQSRRLKTSFETLEDIIDYLTRNGIPFEAYAHPGGYAWIRTDTLVQYDITYRWYGATQYAPDLHATVAEAKAEATVERLRTMGAEILKKKKSVFKATRSELSAFRKTVQKLRKTGQPLTYVIFDGVTLVREKQ